MSRRAALLRLAWAYTRHVARQRFHRPPLASAAEVLVTYGRDGFRPLTQPERELLPAAARCISCGLCALVVKRVAGVRPPDLPAAYLRDHTLLPAAAADLEVGDPGAHALAAAAAVCPVGVPLDEVAAAVRRLAEPPS